MRWPIWRAAVAEHSMEPALRPGDYLLLARPVRAGQPVRFRPGRVVIARQPGDEHLLLVKRAIRVEPGGWWLESDNPGAGAGAVDSWRFGPVPPALIEGRLLLRYWPLRRPAGPVGPAGNKNPGGDGLAGRPRPDRGT